MIAHQIPHSCVVPRYGLSLESGVRIDRLYKKLRILRQAKRFKSRQAEDCLLTSSGSTDGIGSQVHVRMSVIAFCKALGFTYHHTPFYEAEHIENSAENLAAFEEFFNLGALGDSYDHEQFLAEVQPVKHIRFLKKEPGLRQSIVSAHDALNLFPQWYDDAERILQEAFWANKAKPAHEHYRVCLHARRGDVTRMSKEAFRMTSNERLMQRLEQVLAAAPKDKPVHVALHSQGKPEDFGELIDKVDSLHLDSDLCETFLDLASADCLILAKSSLSFAAGVLNSKRVVYEPFWQMPLSRWEILD